MESDEPRCKKQRESYEVQAFGQEMYLQECPNQLKLNCGFGRNPNFLGHAT
jgi:hypothetical protein